MTLYINRLQAKCVLAIAMGIACSQFATNLGADESRPEYAILTLEDAADLIREHPDAKVIHLVGEEANDNCLTYLNYLPLLENLNCAGSNITVRGLSELQTTRTVTSLNVSFNKNIDDDLSPVLRRFPKLEKVALVDTLVGDKVCRSLAENCGALSSVRLDATKITDSGVAHLSKFEGLEALTMSLCDGLTDGVGESVAKMKNLKELNVAETATSDQSCKNIATLPKLESLKLAATAITDNGAISLGASRTIKDLQLFQTDVGDAGVKGLSRLPLEELDLRRTKVTDEAIPDIAAMKSLKTVWISNTQISQDGGFRLKGLRPDLVIK